MAVLQDIAAIVHESANIVTAMVEYKLSGKCRQVESGLTKAVTGLGLLKIFFWLLVAGIGFLLWGFYRVLAAKLSPPASALVLGGALVLIGLLLCLLILQTASRK